MISTRKHEGAVLACLCYSNLFRIFPRQRKHPRETWHVKMEQRFIWLNCPCHHIPPYERGIISKFERIVYGVFVFFVSKSFQNNQATSATATSATAATAAWHSSCNLPQRHSQLQSATAPQPLQLQSATAAAMGAAAMGAVAQQKSIIMSETCWQLLARRKCSHFQNLRLWGEQCTIWMHLVCHCAKPSSWEEAGPNRHIQKKNIL